MNKDISTRNDIEILVTNFYQKVRADELIAPIFGHVDWMHHTPIIVDFWASMLLGDQSYRNNPFQKHINLPLKPEHFTRWLALFTATIDNYFSGPKATEAKERAQSIAGIFQHKLGLL